MALCLHVNELAPISIFRKFVKAPIVSGIGPIKVLYRKINSASDGKLPNGGGSRCTRNSSRKTARTERTEINHGQRYQTPYQRRHCACNWVVTDIKDFQFYWRPVVSGIGPIRLFKDSLNSVSDSKLSNKVGIDSISRFPLSLNVCGDINWPMVLGMMPPISLVSKVKVDRTWKLPIEVGKVPPLQATLENKIDSILP